MKVNKNNFLDNTYRLSYVEFVSGIEVLKAALFFRNNPFMHKKIIQHALDEYRHSSIFRKLSEYSNENKQKSTPTMLIKEGGMDKSIFPLKYDNLDYLCSYLYIGELRAIKFNIDASKQITDFETQKILKQIAEDENGHASGVQSYLVKRPRFKIFFWMTYIKIKFLFNKTRSNFITKLQTKALLFLAKSLFNYTPQSIFNLSDNKIDIQTALKKAKDMV